MILSGVNSSSLQAVSDADMLKFVQKRFQDKPSARLLCVFLSCYSLPDKEFKQLLEPLEEHKDIAVKVRLISGTSKSLKRLVPVMSDRAKENYKRKSQSIDQLRAPSKILEIAYNALNNDLPTSDFPFIGGEPIGVQRKPPRSDKEALLRQRDPNAGKIILFVVGGMTRGEVYGLQALEKELANEQLIVGSTEIFTSELFMEAIIKDHQILETADQGILIEEIKVEER